MKAVREFFRIQIKNEIIPSKKNCDEFISKYPALQNRPWKNIKYCVKNLIQKNRKIVKL